jgi:hypothetical protein
LLPPSFTGRRPDASASTMDSPTAAATGGGKALPARSPGAYAGSSCVRSWRLPHFPGVGGGPPGLPLMARPGPAVEARREVPGAVMVWSAVSRRGQTITGGEGLMLRDGGVSVRDVMARRQRAVGAPQRILDRAAVSAVPAQPKPCWSLAHRPGCLRDSCTSICRVSGRVG